MNIRKSLRQSCLFSNEWGNDGDSWHTSIDKTNIFFIGVGVMMALLVGMVIIEGFNNRENASDMADLSCEELYGVINDIPEFDHIYILAEWDKIGAVYNSRCKA